MDAVSKHPTTIYAKKVLEGDIVAGKLVRLACERHINDLKRTDIYFDVESADHAIGFFDFLTHWKGKWAGEPLVLEEWQKFVVGSIFGWKRPDGLRRYRTVYEQIARKNGKSLKAAGVGLYMLIGDNEPGSEVYSAATKRDQAKEVWDSAMRMVQRSRPLRKYISIHASVNNMSVEATGSKFEPLGADADSLDGKNVHCAIVDELHAHKTRAMWDVLDSATSARLQPLMYGITTAGFNQAGICFDLYNYAQQVLKETVQDDTFFAYIAQLDEEDDWRDPSVWIKANPNLKVSVFLDDLKRKCKQAEAMPSAQNNFKTKHLNMWTQQENRWISLELWDENAGVVDEERLRGRPCYAGLDLSSVSDITAFVMAFPWDNDEDIDVVARFWCPEARLYDAQNRYRDQYQAWHEQGYLRIVPGDAIDYDFILEDIKKDAAKFRIVDLNIDRLFQSHQMSMDLANEGFEVFPMGQGWMSMTVPMNEFERLLLKRKIHHGGNPMLRWMADNMVVKVDASGNKRPDKDNSQGKIDGIVSLIMAIDRVMRHREAPQHSVYEDRGLLLL